MPADEVEFMRWRAERWMKVRHFPVGARARPGVRAAARAADARAHLPRQHLRSLLGLEDERDAFRRYKHIRRRERVFFDEADRPAGRPA